MLIAAGIIYGYSVPNDHTVKSEHYKRVQELAYKFAEENGSYVCRDLLGLSGASNPHSPERTKEFFEKRPCPELCRKAAKLLDDYINEHGMP